MTPKKLVSIIATILILCSAVVISNYVIQVGFEKILTQAIRFILTCLLSYSLIKGWNPGRWIAIILTGLGGVISIVTGFAVLSVTAYGLLLVLLGLIYITCVVTLLMPKARSHFKKQVPSIQTEKIQG